MAVDSAGKLEARIEPEKGKLQADTDLKVSARELAMTLLSHRAEGDGSVHLNVTPGPPESLSAWPSSSGPCRDFMPAAGFRC